MSLSCLPNINCWGDLAVPGVHVNSSQAEERCQQKLSEVNEFSVQILWSSTPYNVDVSLLTSKISLNGLIVKSEAKRS